MKKTVYILGNPLVASETLMFKLIPKLQKRFPQLSFVHLDPTEEIPKEEELIFIDVVIGISKVRTFNDLKDFVLSPRVSPHDFDLPLSLGLGQKMGKIKRVTIIGIPEKGDLIKIAKEAERELRASGL